MSNNARADEFDRRRNYARIHPPAEILSATTGYDVAAAFRLTLIGDNGGGYVFALDHAVEPPRYVGLSLLAADRSELNALGENFRSFWPTSPPDKPERQFEARNATLILSVLRERRRWWSAFNGLGEAIDLDARGRSAMSRRA